MRIAKEAVTRLSTRLTNHRVLMSTADGGTVNVGTAIEAAVELMEVPITT